MGGRLLFLLMGLGTTVLIRLPKAVSPSWFLPQLSLFSYSTVIVLDDDSSIHKVWSRRFEKIRKLAPHQISIKHFFTPHEIKSWVGTLFHTHAVILIDYELLGFSDPAPGLKLSLSICADSIVTSRCEESVVFDRCVKLGIRLLPKGMAPYVPVRVEYEVASTPTEITARTNGHFPLIVQ